MTLQQSSAMIKIPFLLMFIVALLLNGCTESKNHSRAVYMLFDKSGSNSKQIGEVQKILKYLLVSLNSKDSLALARIDSASFSDKDIIAKITFDLRPSQANAQKRAFLEATEKFSEKGEVSPITDITGGVLQAIEYLNETSAGTKYILIFSDLKEEAKNGHVRDFPINFDGIKVVALNVNHSHSDKVDHKEYIKRQVDWSVRVEEGGGLWRVLNDLEHLGDLFE